MNDNFKQSGDVKYTVYLTVAVFVIILGISQGLYYLHKERIHEPIGPNTPWGQLPSGASAR